MCSGVLPPIEFKYNYGIDVLFNALYNIKYCNTFFNKEKSDLFLRYSNVLQVILKNSSFDGALQEILCLPHGEPLVDIMLSFCNFSPIPISWYNTLCADYYKEEKRKLFLLDEEVSRSWASTQFEVYILTMRTQSFSVGKTSSFSEHIFFIPFKEKKSFINSVTHELIHFKIANMFENVFMHSYQEIIAQEIAVRLIDIHLNKRIGRIENIYHKKLEMAALGYLPVFMSCLKKSKNFINKSDMDLENIKSIIIDQCSIISHKKMNLGLKNILMKNPHLILNFIFYRILSFKESAGSKSSL